TAKRFVRNFRNMRSAKHYQCAGGTNRVRHLVSSRSHPRHGAYSCQTYVIGADKLCHFLFGEWLSVPINKENLMLRRCKTLQQEHAEMRHEVSRDAIVWTVEQNVQSNLSFFEGMTLSCASRTEGNGKQKAISRIQLYSVNENVRSCQLHL